jgi:DNA repair photolyase
MKPIVVSVPGVKAPIAPSPGFAKKDLATEHLELGALCAYGCSYCSSNTGNYLRINRQEFLGAIEEQTGRRIAQVPVFEEQKDPVTKRRLRVLTHEREAALHIRFDDVLERLAAQLDGKPASFGEGKTLVFSMLTDSFAPAVVGTGVTRAALELLLKRTSFRIRVLTKSAIVGTDPWREFFFGWRKRFVVGLSIGNLDRAWARAVEIGTSSPTARVKALHRLQDDGIAAFGMLCPIFPHVEGDALEDLVEAIRPEMCETIWAEPFNDRQSGAAIRDGYPEGSPWRKWMNQAFGLDGTQRERGLWSSYATKLYEHLRTIAVRDGWIDRLKFLLYEGDIGPGDAWRFEGLKGVLLQGPKGDDGRSKNPGFAYLEKKARRARRAAIRS